MASSRNRSVERCGRRGRPVESGGMSHRTIAKRLGVSKTLVQQIEASALRKLRMALGGDQ